MVLQGAAWVKRLDRFLFGRPWITAASFLLLVLLLLPAKYETNDDFTMVSILSGQDGFAPSADVPFLSAILRHLLFGLYQIAPTTAWFGLFLYLSMFLSYAVLLRTLGHPRVASSARLLVFPLLAATGLHCLTTVSFTSTTLLLEFSAMLALFLPPRSPEDSAGDRRQGWRLFALASGALIAAYLWRWELALVCLPLVLPGMLVMRREQIVRAGLVVLVLVGVVIVDRFWNAQQTATPAHQEYAEFSRWRAQFHDSPAGRPSERTEEALKAAGWSEQDYRFFRQYWFIYDERRFNTAALKTFLDQNRPSAVSYSPRQIAATLKFSWDTSRYYVLSFAFSVLALLAACPVERERRRRGLALLMLVGAVLVLAAYRFPARVSMPLLAYTVAAAVVLLGDRLARPSRMLLGRALPRGRRVLAWAFAALALFLVLWWMRIDLSSLRTEREIRQFVQEGLRDFTASRAEPPVLVFLDPSSEISRASLHPLMSDPGWGTLRLFPGGWQVGSPRYHQALEQLGFASGSEFLRAMVDREDLILVNYVRPWTDEAELRQLWESYFEQHLLPSGTEVNLKLLQVYGRAGQQLRFYRLVATARSESRSDPDLPSETEAT